MTNARGTQSAVRGVTPMRDIRMRERAYNYRLLRFTRKKTKTQTAYDPQREFLRVRANPVCLSKPAWH
jgi:hypothetical protein